MLIGFKSIHPGGPAGPCLRIRPATVGFQDSTEADDPWCNFDIDKREIRSKEKGPLVASSRDKLVEAGLQLLRIRNLRLLVLRLKDSVEVWDNVPVDLGRQYEFSQEESVSHDLSTVESGHAV